MVRWHVGEKVRPLYSCFDLLKNLLGIHLCQALSEILGSRVGQGQGLCHDSSLQQGLLMVTMQSEFPVTERHPRCLGGEGELPQQNPKGRWDPGKVEQKHLQKGIAWQRQEDPWGLLVSESGLTCEHWIQWEIPAPYLKTVSSTSVFKSQSGYPNGS